ncbi:metal ABC transporter solute-binding protein, Zn/Mn family [Pollutimonas bauzanensis]|uniref:ABC-type Zn uptake system ZnuABC, Zn-binding component ZnuA n=1 Tax=Pollutimonas bauzanensis TaxID=658167 RepID=A0A1M6A7Z9_9BURK|nr:zinc ABC transporter substrate-binding protein [Pollutimonas bauzanensis]SHI32644.1 ABC-type Zn uptake system ZnuABC, Zn-binding component ZnuA [Pollutimonas bauzanensis]
MKRSSCGALGALTLALALGCGSPLSVAPAAAGERAAAAKPGAAAVSGIKVLVAHPVVHALAQALAQDSGISVQLAAPASLPATRMASYFAGRGAAALRKAAEDADAAAGLRSIWPEDPLYPLARRANIRIVEIDAARPIDGALPGIALQPGSGASAYPWLDPVNLGRMADIMAADLERLTRAAADKAALAKNLGEFKHRLVALAAQAQAQLAGVDNVSVATLSDRLAYLASGFDLDLVLSDARPDADWSGQSLAAFAASLKSNGVALVLHHREPAADVRQAVASGGARLVVLATDDADPVAQLQANIRTLVHAFKS